jgi:hypothetical protein
VLTCVRTGRMVAVLCSVSLVWGGWWPTLARGEAAPPAASPQGASRQTDQPAPKLPDEQLDSLVAPIALYPDPLLAQVLAASTYPLEIVELQQWLAQHKDLKDEALVEAVKKQDWDPSVQAMAAVPDAVKLLASDIKWTTELGNAFLAQESDVMQAVQRMRKKAKDKGALKSDDKIKVETQKVENETVVVIQQANPQVIYVPTYSPVVVYGPAPYPYPPPPPGYVAGVAMISFGIGVAMGAAFHGGWGYSCGWGGHHSTYVNVNRNNTYVRNTAVAGGRGGTAGRWEHNPRHRGGAPYGDRGTADRFGGRADGGSRGRRDGDRGRDDAARGGRDDAARGGGRENAARGGGREDAARGGGRENAGGGNRVGNRSVAPASGSGRAKGGEAFSGGSRDSYSGSKARSSSARGSSSKGSRGGGARGGGGSRGGRGGGRR